MHRGCALAPNKNMTPTDGERDLIELIIRDCHVMSVSEWLVNQKPKIHAKFMQFLLAVTKCPVPSQYCNASGDIAKRLGRDIVSMPFHPVLRRVVDDRSGEFSDVHLGVFQQRHDAQPIRAFGASILLKCWNEIPFHSYFTAARVGKAGDSSGCSRGSLRKVPGSTL
jgi:hypothetical protein